MGTIIKQSQSKPSAYTHTPRLITITRVTPSHHRHRSPFTITTPTLVLAMGKAMPGSTQWMALADIA
jgi:hypothetical protein